MNKVHDRFIVIDKDTKNMKAFLCGSSSKDSGNSITMILQIKGVDSLIKTITALLTNPLLVLK